MKGLWIPQIRELRITNLSADTGQPWFVATITSPRGWTKRGHGRSKLRASWKAFRSSWG